MHTFHVNACNNIIHVYTQLSSVYRCSLRYVHIYIYCIACYNDRYQREFGFTIPSRDIKVDDIRVRAMGKACSHNPTPITTPASDIPVPTKVSYKLVM